jgi:hypothetical protein
MLHFVVTAAHAYTLLNYFGQWGASLRPLVRVLSYESSGWRADPAPGTWVFTDLERLDERTLDGAIELKRRLASDPARWQVLNDPSRALCRYPLLGRLSAEGINSFRAFRLDEVPQDARYPLFVRGEQDHDGSRSPLLPDPAALRAFVAQQGDMLRRIRPLAIEYLPYQRADGLFVKYSAMRVGPVLVPRHMLFARQWQVKDPELVDDPLVAQEHAFIEAFQGESRHAKALMAIFDMAGIDYGRIDYTVLDDRIQVFEINTNPTLVPRVAELHPKRWQGQAASALRLNQALQAAARHG